VRCLDDVDETIRMRALDLVSAMVNEENVRDVVRLLMAKLKRADGNDFAQRIVSKVGTVPCLYCTVGGVATPVVYLPTGAPLPHWRQPSGHCTRGCRSSLY
jgi:hypothetical protein